MCIGVVICHFIVVIKSCQDLQVLESDVEKIWKPTDLYNLLCSDLEVSDAHTILLRIPWTSQLLYQNTLHETWKLLALLNTLFTAFILFLRKLDFGF
jgi:hypothetical protein